MFHFDGPEPLAALAPVIVIVAFGITALTIILHVIFAVAVFIDADEFMRKHRRTVLVGPFVWMLVTLIGGVFVAAIYWAMHRSTLRREEHVPEV